MATAGCTQACFHAAGTHAVLRPQGEMLGRWSGGSRLGGRKLGVNYVESTEKSYKYESLMYGCIFFIKTVGFDSEGEKYLLKMKSTCLSVCLSVTILLDYFLQWLLHFCRAYEAQLPVNNFEYLRPPLKMLIIVYFDSTNTSYTLICIDTSCGIYILALRLKLTSAAFLMFSLLGVLGLNL